MNNQIGFTSFRRGFVLALLSALMGTLAGWAAHPKESLKEPPSMTSEPLSLESLADLGEFKITTNGKSLQSYPSLKSCAYFEWHFGAKASDSWEWRSKGYQSEDSLFFETPRGELEVSVRQCRMFLTPVFSRTFAPGVASEAPEVVQERLLEEKVPLTVEEFLLEPGKTYFARLDTESYHLPPRDPDSKPVKRKNTVLWISDQPYKEGKPQRPITPSYKGWSY